METPECPHSHQPLVPHFPPPGCPTDQSSGRLAPDVLLPVAVPHHPSCGWPSMSSLDSWSVATVIPPCTSQLPSPHSAPSMPLAHPGSHCGLPSTSLDRGDDGPAPEFCPLQSCQTHQQTLGFLHQDYPSPISPIPHFDRLITCTPGNLKSSGHLHCAHV